MGIFKALGHMLKGPFGSSTPKGHGYGTTMGLLARMAQGQSIGFAVSAALSVYQQYMDEWDWAYVIGMVYLGEPLDPDELESEKFGSVLGENILKDLPVYISFYYLAYFTTKASWANYMRRCETVLLPQQDRTEILKGVDKALRDHWHSNPLVGKRMKLDNDE